MREDRLVAGLDIGSAKTTALIAEVVGDFPKHPSIKILGVGQTRTTGLRKGVVADIEESTRSIQKALHGCRADGRRARAGSVSPASPVSTSAR